MASTTTGRLRAAEISSRSRSGSFATGAGTEAAVYPGFFTTSIRSPAVIEAGTGAFLGGVVCGGAAAREPVQLPFDAAGARCARHAADLQLDHPLHVPT